MNPLMIMIPSMLGILIIYVALTDYIEINKRK